MKHLRVSARVAESHAPALFNLLAHSPEVEQARVLEVNTLPSGTETFLIAIDGDPSAFAAGATDTPGVESVTLSEPGHGRAYAMVVVDTPETPLFEAMQRASNDAGLVVRTPFTYRDGGMYGRVVGDPEPLQRALDQAPPGLDVSIEEIGEFDGGLDDPTTRLSERQREALEVAREMGYYEQPRGATHEEIAAELDCAPQTASTHLQKAEAKLVDAALDEFGPDV